MAKKQNGPDVAGENYVQALYEFGYDAKRPRVERGEVFELGGHPNDKTLISLHYVAEVKPGTPLKQCGSCGKLFADDESRTAHGDIWHAYTCECDWVAPAGSPTARAKALALHREKCPTVREARTEARQAHITEVRNIKAGTPIVVSEPAQ